MSDPIKLAIHELKEQSVRLNLIFELVEKLDLISAKDNIEYAIEENNNLLKAITKGD